MEGRVWWTDDLIKVDRSDWTQKEVDNTLLYRILGWESLSVQQWTAIG